MTRIEYASVDGQISSQVSRSAQTTSVVTRKYYPATELDATNELQSSKKIVG